MNPDEIRARRKERLGRYKSEDELFEAVTNKNMVCVDCVYRFPEDNKVARCFKYPDGKPNTVIYGGKCPKYSKE